MNQIILAFYYLLFELLLFINPAYGRVLLFYVDNRVVNLFRVKQIKYSKIYNLEGIHSEYLIFNSKEVEKLYTCNIDLAAYRIERLGSNLFRLDIISNYLGENEKFVEVW